MLLNKRFNHNKITIIHIAITYIQYVKNLTFIYIMSFFL